MTAKIMLFREQFSRHEQEIYHSDNFTVTSFKYASGIEALKITNSRGYVTLLPYYGQMIWDAEFDGHNLKMDNMFSQPKRGRILSILTVVLLSIQVCCATVAHHLRTTMYYMAKCHAQTWIKPGYWLMVIDWH